MGTMHPQKVVQITPSQKHIVADSYDGPLHQMDILDPWLGETTIARNILFSFGNEFVLKIS